MDSDMAYCLNTVVGAALIGLIPAYIAYRRGRSFVTWWVFGAALFIVALPMALLLKTDTAELEKRQLGSGEVRRCPFCAELIKREAIVCRYCGRNLPAVEDEGPGQTG